MSFTKPGNTNTLHQHNENNYVDISTARYKYVLRINNGDWLLDKRNVLVAGVGDPGST